MSHTTLRTRVPVLISQLLDHGVTVTLKPLNGYNKVVLTAKSYTKGGRLRHTYHASIPFEPGIHGANSILLERHLVLALEEVTIARMNQLGEAP